MNSVPDQKPTAPPPAGLAEGDDSAGRRLWHAVTSDYQLRPDELCILENACFLADDIASWEALAQDSRRAAGNERVVRGSTGQRVTNPLLVRADKAKAEALKCRTAQVNMIAKLNLPDNFDPTDEQSGKGGTEAEERAAATGRSQSNSVA